MNRREFCLTAGLLATAPLFGGVVKAHPGNTPASFRAKKVYLDSRDAEIAWHELRRDGYNAVILMPGRHSRADWLKQVGTEANRLEFAVFVPAQLTCDFFRDAQMVVPLAYEEGRLRSQVTWATDNGGVLLMNESGGIHGLVLYDASRCLWTGFAASGIACIPDSECYADASKLTAARWLDYTRRSLTGA